MGFTGFCYVLLGFIGATLVLGLDVGSDIPLLGLLATIVALIAITTSTIWQKKFTNKLSLSVNNFYQALAAAIQKDVLRQYGLMVPGAPTQYADPTTGMGVS